MCLSILVRAGIKGIERCSAGINHFNQAQIILKLLATGRNTLPEHRQEAGALITADVTKFFPRSGPESC
jgi:hypothetical protein